MVDQQQSQEALENLADPQLKPSEYEFARRSEEHTSELQSH